MSKLGYTLTVRFGKEQETYTVIGQRKNHLGRTLYAVSVWNKVSHKFVEFSEDSYFFAHSKATFSASAAPLSPDHRAMATAYTLSHSIRKLNRLIRQAGNGLVSASHLAAFTGFRGKFDMVDPSGYRFVADEPDFVFGDEIEKQRLSAMRRKRIVAWEAAMQAAGIL